MDQLVDAFVVALSVVVVRPARMAAREHSHFGCAAYACEKIIPPSASFSVLGVLKFFPLLNSFPAIISTDRPAQLWSSAKIKRKLGGVCACVVIALAGVFDGGDFGVTCTAAPNVNKKATAASARVSWCNFIEGDLSLGA